MADQTRTTILYDVLYEQPLGTTPSGVSVSIITYPIVGVENTKTLETHVIPKEQLKVRIIQEDVDGVTQNYILSVFMITSTIITLNTNMIKNDGTNYTNNDIAAIYIGLQAVIGSEA